MALDETFSQTLLRPILFCHFMSSNLHVFVRCIVTSAITKRLTNTYKFGLMKRQKITDAEN
jgi:hypothetical protein